MNVGNLCRREVVTIGSSVGLVEAAQLMRQRHVGFLVVVESRPLNTDRRITGVLTDRDIVTAVVAKEADPRKLNVGDIMTRNPLLASEWASLEATVGHMRQAGVRRVPVVGARDELTGVLSLDDVLESVASLVSDLSGAIRSEQKAERTARP